MTELSKTVAHCMLLHDIVPSLHAQNALQAMHSAILISRPATISEASAPFVANPQRMLSKACTEQMNCLSENHAGATVRTVQQIWA